MNPEAAIEFERVVKTYGRNLLFRGMTLILARGSITGVTGANGCGKTVFLNMINGLERPDGGVITINGIDIASMEPHRIARLGVARTFQTPSLAPNLTVGEHLALATRLGLGDFTRSVFSRDINRSTTRRVVNHLAQFDLEDAINVPLGELSVGQQKIVENVAALTAPVEILLMDEPVSGLSSSAKAQLLAHLRRWLTPQRTAIIVEHDLDFLLSISSQTAVILEGYIALHARPHGLGSPSAPT